MRARRRAASGKHRSATTATVRERWAMYQLHPWLSPVLLWLSTSLLNEQRKWLTIVVELVANPSISFMDEPTTGLDARATAIVMRALKNAADTGRTIVCTIHQPSIDIFEAFDESIPGVPNTRNNYNLATWMLDVTSTSAEAKLGIDFALKYKESTLYEKNKELVRQLSSPPPGSRDLYFPTLFSQNGWGQFKSCQWKQHLAY